MIKKLLHKRLVTPVNTRLGFFILIIFILIEPGFAQQTVSTIQQQFETYNNNNYQEKVFLHTDKTVYATGEILWFKAYVTDAASTNFSRLSKICYVEIINDDNKPVLQAKIDIDSGRGNGSFQIPSSIRSGNYIIRAYTNWMKNFDARYYFVQVISIINPNKKPLANIADTLHENDIRFFPEGGNIVYGFNNTIAYKITDLSGKGLPAQGFIVNNKKDTVANFATERFGMGTFLFNPVKGDSYYAIIKINDKNFKRDLPKIYTEGWLMHVSNNDNKILVNVSCNISTQQHAFLFAQTRHKVKLASMQTLNNGTAIFTINKSELDEGISQLTVFNEERQPVCERLFFIKPTHVLKIKLDDLHSQYSQRNKVELNVSTDEANGGSIDANMSASVYLIDSLQPEQKTNLLFYQWLTSDIKGTIESPGYYFTNSGAEVDKATDNLMLTQGWRRFNWEDILNNKTPSFTFLPENEGHIISGKLSPKSAGLKDAAVSAYLSVPGKNFKFSNSSTTASGNIKFNVDKFYGNRELIAQTNLADSNYALFIDNPFSEKYNDLHISSLNLNKNFTDDILLRSIGAQANDIYEPETETNFISPVAYDTTAFYGTPFKSYNLDAYTRFPTMEEVIKEFVKEVHLKKRDKDFYFEVFNQPDISYFEKEPLILLDGVPVFNVNKIIEIDPLKIKKIDVTATKFFKGGHEYDGIVSFSTYNGDLDGYQLDPNALVVEYEGLQFKREFYNPQYQTQQEQSSRLPDYRNVLYWSPKVDTKNGKENLSFYTSDIPGNYVIFIQGISTSGLVGFTTKYFTVLPASSK